MKQKYSQEFLEFVTGVGECKTKTEEKYFVEDEIIALKNCTEKDNQTFLEKRENLLKLLYLEMLGYDSLSFGYNSIAIKLIGEVNKNKVQLKKLGYLFVNLYLPRDKSLKLLFVQQTKKDLSNTNVLIVSMALETITNFLELETLQMYKKDLLELLTHEKGLIRKKVIIVFKKYLEIQKSKNCGDILTDPEILKIIEKGITDVDPSVMGSTLDLILCYITPFESIEESILANSFTTRAANAIKLTKDFVPSFITIINQIVGGQLKKNDPEYYFKGIPCPWYQIKFLKILAILGENDQKVSQIIYKPLHSILKQCNIIPEKISYAVLIETIRTISRIYPSSGLLSLASESIRSFITSKNINLKYLGLKLLCSSVKTNKSIAIEYQELILGFLGSQDITILKKALEILYTIANSSNVNKIVKKLFTLLRRTVDNYFSRELIVYIFDISENFAPNYLWFIKIINILFKLAGNQNSDVIDYKAVVKCINEGYSFSSSKKDVIFKIGCVDLFYNLCSSNLELFPENFLKIIVYTFGEYGYLSTSYSISLILGKILDILDHNITPETRFWALSAVFKILGNHSCCFNEEINQIINSYSNSKDIVLRQLCNEFKLLNQFGKTAIFSQTTEDDEIDEDLSFLNDYVAQHTPIQEEKEEEDIELLLPKFEKKLKFEYDDNDSRDANMNEKEPEEMMDLETLVSTTKSRTGGFWDDSGFVFNENEEENEKEIQNKEIQKEKKKQEIKKELLNTLKKKEEQTIIKKKKKKRKIVDALFSGLDDDFEGLDELGSFDIDFKGIKNSDEPELDFSGFGNQKEKEEKKEERLLDFSF